MTNYRLSPRARADLNEIFDYTVERWGLLQAEFYIRQIQVAVEAVAASPTLGRSCDGIRPGYRKFPAGSHVLFFTQKPGRIEIVRILHNRMDFERHF